MIAFHERVGRSRSHNFSQSIPLRFPSSNNLQERHLVQSATAVRDSGNCILQHGQERLLEQHPSLLNKLQIKSLDSDTAPLGVL